jgi:hypothetical protein
MGFNDLLKHVWLVDMQPIIPFWRFPGHDRLLLRYERYYMKMIIERVQNITESVEMKYWEKNLLHFHICSTKSP